MKNRWIPINEGKSSDRWLYLDWNYLQGTKIHKHTYEHTLINMYMSTTHEYNHIPEHTHTHTSVTAAINYYIPASCLGIALAWTAPSHIPHSSSSQTSSLSSLYSSVFLSVNRGWSYMSQIFRSPNSSPRAWTLSHLPAAHLYTSCIFSISQFSLLLPTAGFHLNSPLLKISFPLYSLHIWTFPQFFLSSPRGEVTPAWRRWPGRSQGTLVATCPPLRKALKASFPDLCLQCHLHALYSCSFLSHSVSVWPPHLLLHLAATAVNAP